MKKMCTKFEMNRSSSFQMAVNTDFEKVVLRKMRLKFMKQKSEDFFFFLNLHRIINSSSIQHTSFSIVDVFSLFFFQVFVLFWLLCSAAQLGTRPYQCDCCP